MTPAFVAVARSLRFVTMEHDESIERRHKVGIDCLSLLSDDGESPSAEAIIIDEQVFFELIRSFESEREKFIALCLYNGYIKQETAFMLGVHPSRVTRNIQAMRKRLTLYLTEKARI
jgi:DNA-directed RNA polymerase specialized sigma24 family protein